MNTILKRTLQVMFLFMLFSCSTEENPIPDRQVYIKRNIATAGLTSSMTYLYIKNRTLATDRIGFGGIVIVRDAEGSFAAFDIACPNECDEDIVVGKPNEMLQCACDSCGEVFDLSFGLATPTKGISHWQLKKYSVRIDGNNNIIVTN